MTDTPWTPGPWRYQGLGEVVPESVTSPVFITTDVESDADGRLIAAAPEMAELLDAWALAFETGEGDIMTNERTWALLARIRGEDVTPPS